MEKIRRDAARNWMNRRNGKGNVKRNGITNEIVGETQLFVAEETSACIGSLYAIFAEILAVIDWRSHRSSQQMSEI